MASMLMIVGLPTYKGIKMHKQLLGYNLGLCSSSSKQDRSAADLAVVGNCLLGMKENTNSSDPTLFL